MFVKTNDGVEHDVKEGFSLSLPNANSQPQLYATPPSAPKPSEPRPDTNKSDPKDVFKEKPPAKGDTSVNVTKGRAAIDSNSSKNTTKLKEGETGSTNKNGETRTSYIQSNESTQNNNQFTAEGSFNDDDPDNSLEGCL
jgi:hypothetical protein